MCGFLGGVFSAIVGDAEEQAFTAALRSIAHRGPDDERLLRVDECNAVLAFRRLSILDHAGGRQPMSNGSGQYVVFNGEVYNYRELRAELEQSGVRLQTRSDTEALLWTVGRQGSPGIAKLVGMYAFALLDTSARQLLLVRDRLGVKQLYYTRVPEGFFFASEPKALLSLPWVKNRFARDQLAAFLAFRTVPAPHTLFDGIHKLGAGQVLSLDLDSGKETVRTYWTLPETASLGEPRDALDRLEASLLESIRRRLIADVPVGAFLSGGLDSSLVVAGMRRLGHQDIATFSATFPGSPDDESVWARRVSARFRTRHFEQPSTPAEFLGMLDRWVELNDDLVADASCLPLLSVSKLARRHGYIVLLSGEGADELFGGYGSYHKFLLLNRLHAILPGAGARRSLLGLLQWGGFFSEQDRPRVEEYLVRGGAFMGAAALLGEPELHMLLREVDGRGSGIRRAAGRRIVDLCAFDFETRVPEDLMVRTDRATMGASIEARVPFLDHEVVKLVFSLPPRQRSLPGVSKVLLRKLARRWGVPRQTIYHRKIGFQLPLGAWFRKELRPLWGRILSDREVPGLDYEHVATIYDAHARERGDYEEILWRLMALELWYRRWIMNSEEWGGLQSSVWSPRHD